jgi:hypothetical protein
MEKKEGGGGDRSQMAADRICNPSKMIEKKEEVF